MATIWEPPALVSMAAFAAVTGGALYYGLRSALRSPLPVVTSERDEVWGADDPPPLPKRPYAYPTEQSVTVADIAEDAPPVEDAPRDAESEDDNHDAVEDEEPSLADLFRPRRRPTHAPLPSTSPPDATPQD